MKYTCNACCLLSRLHVVSALWLLACCTEGGRVDEAPYTCLDLTLPGEGVESEGGRVGRKEGGKRKRRLEEGAEERGGGKRLRVAEGEEEDNDETRLDEEALLLQYQNG